MAPITGVVEKKAAESVWTYLQKWFTRNQDLKKQIVELKAELAEERSGRLAFERLMSELESRPEDDHMYWRKDGKGGPYCPTCLHGDRKLIPLTIYGEGSFYCIIHEHVFETHERRERIRYRQQSQQPRYRPRNWMAR
jgi:hypothetical protein